MDLMAVNERRPDWQGRLITYLQSIARQAFRPGRNDCALFAAGAVEAMTGTDLAAPWRGQYDSLEDGLALLRSAGLVDHIALAERHFAEVAPAFARAGDLAVVPSDDEWPAMGIVQGAGVYVLAPSGLSVVARRVMDRAFSV